MRLTILAVGKMRDRHMAALCDDYVARADCSYFHRFKEHRQHFELIASRKYDSGYVEGDGTVCIKSIDLPLIGSD